MTSGKSTAFSTDDYQIYSILPEQFLLSSHFPGEKVTTKEVKEVMEEVLKLVHNRVEKAYPNYKDLSREELIAWVQVDCSFRPLEYQPGAEGVMDITCAVLLLFLSWEKFELKQLVRFIETARFIHTNGSTDPAKTKHFSELITPLLQKLYSV
jgi:hypothetical protein